MIKKTLFTIDYHEFPNFLNDEDINAVIKSLYKGKLREYDYIEGKAYTTMGENETETLDYHPDIAKRIEENCFVKNQRVSQSWCTIQGPDSKLKYHKHPQSIISGIIYLKVDDNSSKLVFQNPTSMEGETKEITPTKGLMLMWPSFLMHGSGTTINKSEERIILGFNTYWK
jgi:hypothetical protein